MYRNQSLAYLFYSYYTTFTIADKASKIVLQSAASAEYRVRNNKSSSATTNEKDWLLGRAFSQRHKFPSSASSNNSSSFSESLSRRISPQECRKDEEWYPPVTI